MNYYLKCYDLYVSEVCIKDGKLINIILDKDFRKMYYDFEEAEDVRKIVYIETGLNLVVKKFKKEEE